MLDDDIFKQYRKTAIVAAITLVVLFIIYLIDKGKLFADACMFAAIVISIPFGKLLRLSKSRGDK